MPVCVGVVCRVLYYTQKKNHRKFFCTMNKFKNTIPYKEEQLRDIQNYLVYSSDIKLISLWKLERCKPTILTTARHVYIRLCVCMSGIGIIIDIDIFKFY